MQISLSLITLQARGSSRFRRVVWRGSAPEAVFYLNGLFVVDVGWRLEAGAGREDYERARFLQVTPQHPYQQQAFSRFMSMHIHDKDSQRAEGNPSLHMMGKLSRLTSFLDHTMTPYSDEPQRNSRLLLISKSTVAID